MASSILVLAAVGVAWLGAIACGASPAQAAFPGENGRIAFERDGDIHVMDPDGGRQMRLTCRGGFAPAWSADGSRIAFHRLGTLPGSDEFWPAISTMSAEGGDKARLPHGFGENPAWSPDGAMIALNTRVSRLGPSEIRVVNVDGSGHEMAPIWGVSPDWSPDGERIAFGGVFLINPDGSDLTRVVYGGVPSWSPDGERIAFLGDDGDLWVANRDGSDEISLTAGSPTSDRLPAWSPDGERIAFARQLVRASDIWTMDADGGDQVWLAEGSRPDWQPLAPGSSLGPPPSQFCFEGLRRNTRRGTARLVVEAPRPGGVVLERRAGVRRAVLTHDGEGEGRVAVPVRARGKAQRRLNRRAKRTGRARVRVRAQVTYTPWVGELRTKGRRVWLVQR